MREYQTIEDLLPQANWSIYRLVRMAVNRAMEISDGQPALTKEAQTDKEASIALQEILEKKVMFKEIADKKAKS